MVKVIKYILRFILAMFLMFSGIVFLIPAIEDRLIKVSNRNRLKRFWRTYIITVEN